MSKPVSDHCVDVMRQLPLPSQQINPGVRGKLFEKGYAEIVKGVSPYAKHKGGEIDFYDLTDRGRAYLKNGT